MENTKRHVAFLAALALMVILVLTGCGGSGETAPAAPADGNVEYKVTLTDALGNTYSDGIIVKFLQDGQEMAMQVVGADGTAVKKLPAGEYTAELVYTSDKVAYNYDADAMVLTAENPAVTVMLSKVTALEAETLVVDSQDYQAYVIGLGCTDVTLQLYRDGRHEMLNELNYQQVHQDIFSWLDQRSKKV